jgi:hypothetical protein
MKSGRASLLIMGSGLEVSSDTEHHDRFEVISVPSLEAQNENDVSPDAALASLQELTGLDRTPPLGEQDSPAYYLHTSGSTGDWIRPIKC